MRRSNSISCGHIPGAICIPNESIGTEPPEELPDFDQIILIYCRSGNRSKQAAQKLFDMGYINVYEFGGINDWTGEVVTKEPDTDTLQESEPEMQITEEKTDMKLKIGDAEVPAIRSSFFTDPIPGLIPDWVM